MPRHCHKLYAPLARHAQCVKAGARELRGKADVYAAADRRGALRGDLDIEALPVYLLLRLHAAAPAKLLVRASHALRLCLCRVLALDGEEEFPLLDDVRRGHAVAIERILTNVTSRSSERTAACSVCQRSIANVRAIWYNRGKREQAGG